jgi:hypothetical protein
MLSPKKNDAMNPLQRGRRPAQPSRFRPSPGAACEKERQLEQYEHYHSSSGKKR